MDQDLILKVVKQHYPFVTGAILTGSSAKNGEIKAGSDVDVLIIDPTFSVISSFVTRSENVYFDFTQVPLSILKI
ncbi:nucleotidyltransferase domain-containing protein [Mucilaginibacter jinjuensis]|uniref:Nucleotidyltransferase domain-containing protein n=1 Tax=Mucilaginibacter jinjuensis TaxID=1176721 RepID=A0ABY7TD02_9SPHI|nr:nucleotidyltransferase domain-containing protein [Mucilaginibacter jinjuensis]WCT14399.1 nucleotidyltransferase domain-containing protein [Mucilaginibacter jinjuensis]